MAKIALSVAATGLMIAAPFTGPAAPFLEVASIALAAGAALIPPKIPGQAPQQDLQVSSSADGAPIPFGYGMMRYAGQVIWSPGITYQKVSSSNKGGPTISVYSYAASFAAAFGEGPLVINRLWGDSRLIYKGGQDYGTVQPWNSTTTYIQDDLVTYHYSPPIGSPITGIFQCVLTNTNVTPEGNSLYWATAPYTFWDSSVQYYPGNEVVFPGLPSEGAQYGEVYACIKPSLNDDPPTSPGHWLPLDTYYNAPTMYAGNETQNPDPLIQGIQGSANTPAFRGIAYAVWENFPLANFGNRVPNLRAEVTFCASGGC
jgi:hypothetical protein